MKNDRSNKDPQELFAQRAGVERRELLLGGTALLTATALSGVASAQTPAPDSIKTRKAVCMCGKLTLTCNGPDPLRRSMCHCNNCQLRTGSVFSVQARYPRNQVKIEGKTTAWKFPVAGAQPVTFRSCDSEGATYHFCPECGSTVYYELDAAPDFIGIAVGAFTDPTFPPPMISGFEEYRHPWALKTAELSLPGGHHN